jgi:hypothetical protein
MHLTYPFTAFTTMQLKFLCQYSVRVATPEIDYHS